MHARQNYEIDVNELKRLYYDEEMSVLLVSKRLEIPKHIIYAEMRRLGLKRRSKSEAQMLRTYGVSTQEMVRLYYVEKKPLGDVALELGVSQLCVRNRLTGAGYVLRSRSESRFLQGGGRSLIVFSSEDKEQIRILYCEDGLSLAIIGFRFSVSPQIIKRTLFEIGIDLRTVKEAQELRRVREYERISKEIAKKAGTVLDTSDVSESDIIKFYNDDKLKIQEVAVKCSLSTVDVYAVLRKAGHVPCI